jgi:periplasmic copper chaperone A
MNVRFFKISMKGYTIMKRRFPLALMAATALTFSLAACDEPADQAAAPAEETQPLTPPAETAVAPESQMPAPAAQVQPITADSATAYATAEGARTGAIFLTLTNTGTASDRLIGATTDKAAMVEIHESYVDEAGTMQMRKVDGIDVAPGTPVVLNPSGYHLMLMDLAAPLTAGETFTVTLDFQNADDVVVPVTVTAPGATTTTTTTPTDGSATTTTAPTGGMSSDPTATDPAVTAPTPTDEPATADQPAADDAVAP